MGEGIEELLVVQGPTDHEALDSNADPHDVVHDGVHVRRIEGTTCAEVQFDVPHAVRRQLLLDCRRPALEDGGQ